MEQIDAQQLRDLNEQLVQKTNQLDAARSEHAALQADLREVERLQQSALSEAAWPR